ncbi:hypothetical protein BGZ70_000138 [Mortierella alpina]|uniref:Uncharacterized protein n=1 Tax=Mortierella alpina TaxID=64518 RepID=A0A9P6IZ23_MORAP|nr:hypothetical protein BGZ70_000138 [Mortierella alpina]
MAGGSITPDRYRDILEHKCKHPDITLEDLAAWAKDALDLARTPRTSTINQILNNVDKVQIREKWEENPSCSAMTLMCWAKDKFRLPGAPTADDIFEIHSICDGGSEIGPIVAQPMPLKNDRSHAGVEQWARDRRSMPHSTWYKKHSGLFKAQRSSKLQMSGRLAQGRPVSYQDKALCEPAENSQPISWLFGIPSLGVIGCLTSESLHYQRGPRSTVASSDEDADHDGETSGDHEITRAKAHSASGGYEPLSDDIGDEADDENDDAYGGYPDAFYTTADGEDVGKQSEGVRTRNARRTSRWTSSAPEEADDMEDTDRSEDQYDIGPAIDQRDVMHRKEDQMGDERDEEDTYMDMDVDEASCILSAMGISKEIENSIVESEMGPSPAQSWTQEQQSISLQVALTTLDPNDLTQRSAYRWSQEEQLQSLFTVATLLDMQNPFHFAAYVVLTNRYNKIKDFE